MNQSLIVTSNQLRIPYCQPENPLPSLLTRLAFLHLRTAAVLQPLTHNSTHKTSLPSAHYLFLPPTHLTLTEHRRQSLKGSNSTTKMQKSTISEKIRALLVVRGRFTRRLESAVCIGVMSHTGLYALRLSCYWLQIRQTQASPARVPQQSPDSHTPFLLSSTGRQRCSHPMGSWSSRTSSAFSTIVFTVCSTVPTTRLTPCFLAAFLTYSISLWVSQPKTTNVLVLSLPNCSM